MAIDYNHSTNVHSVGGPQAALPILFAKEKPASLLDVGCGTGTWLKAALDYGIRDVFGVDGVELPSNELHVPSKFIRHLDLTMPWNLGRRFDATICLEVAEHLDATFAPVLIDALVRHSERVYFSAACPAQPGQHHVNCQWPAYWQRLFNGQGYVCEDDLRWQMWEDNRIEPWYRQNLFLARRSPDAAGAEPRIRSVVHPEIWKLEKDTPRQSFAEHVHQIEQGRMPTMWNMTVPARALRAKLRRKLK